MGKKEKKEPFLKDKPYLLSFFVAFSVLVIVYSLMSITKIAGPNMLLDGNTALALAATVALACFFMSITDRINIQNNFLIAIIDIGDIVASVFLINFVAAIFINKSGLFFDVDDIATAIIMIVITYTLVCLVFYINGVSSERKINEKLNKMKQEVNKFEQDNRGK